MKILFITQYFHPENFRGNDVAFHLAAQGHDVHVVTAIPNYPEGRFYDGYGLFKRRHEVIGGVKVTRLPVVPRGKGKLALMLNYLSFMMVGWIYVLCHAIFHRYDAVLCQQLSPVMTSAPAVLYKKLRGVPLYTWVLDLWPDVFTALTGIDNRLVMCVLRHFSAQEYKWSDRILISSRSFERKILEYGDYSHKLVYYPQWSMSSTQQGALSNESAIAGLGLSENDFVIMFAGAVGDAQGFECNLRAALLTKEHRNIKWVIVGNGRKLAWVRDFVAGHGLQETVLTPGYFPTEQMPALYAHANVMLASLDESSLFSLYLPAKISSYMASGKAIVTCMNGEGADVVRDADCGWHIPAGDAEGLARLAVELSTTDKEILHEKGANGLRYYNEYFEKEKCLGRLDEIMGL